MKEIKVIFDICFKELGYDINSRVIVSNRSDLCDFQCDDLFKLSKFSSESIDEIGKKVIDYINNLENFTSFFKEVTFVKPGFINIILSDVFINNYLNMMFSDKKYLLDFDTDNYFLDYGGPNIAKPLHVGHLRTAIIGESIKRILKFVGNDVMCDVHLGDFGLQIGQVIYKVIEDGISLSDITLEYLDVTYPYMSGLCKENSEILVKCAKITKSLQDGDEKYLEIYNKIKIVSLSDIKRLYTYLSVNFDKWDGESDSYKFIKDLTNLFKSKGLLTNSNGAVVIDVSDVNDKKEVVPLIYQKSNGAYLYGTTDLASLYERVNLLKYKNILYVVDSRQSLHFKQVFRAFNKLCDCKLEFLGYGTVNGTDGRPFKTRTGDAFKLDDLFSLVKEEFINVKESNKDLSEADLDILVNSIIKFADLQNDYIKDYIFDISKFSNVTGKTGPYISYTYLRMNKILLDNDLEIDLFNNIIYNEYDRSLRIKLLHLEKYFTLAYNERKPSYIADFVYELSVISNIVYQNNNITNASIDCKQQWLLLIKNTNKLIFDMLNLLGIDVPSKM